MTELTNERQTLLDEIQTLRAQVESLEQLESVRQHLNMNDPNSAELLAIVNALPGLVSVVDANMNVLVANNEVYRRFGQGSLDDVIGKPCFATRKGLTEPCPHCGILEAYQTGETVVRTSTPEEEALMGIATKAYAVPLRNTRGEIWGGVEVIVDVSDLRRMERIAKEGEENLRITLESIGDAVIAVNKDGHIIRMNPEAERLTGWTAQDAIGHPLQTVFKVVESHNRAAINRIFEAMITADTANARRSDLILLSKDGNEWRIDQNGSPIHTEGGDIVGGVLVFRDITEKLEILEQLHHDRKMDALGQLAGGVAHDFNNMLAGIMGFADVLKHHLASDDRGHALAERIVDTATRASELSQKLLAFSRKGAAANTDFDVHEVVNAAIDILERSIDRKIRIERQLNATQPWICGDKTQLQNAVLNLGINARDAMPDGGTLTVTTEDLDIQNLPSELQRTRCHSKKCMQLEIIDTGGGIPQDIQHRIFEPFFTTKSIGKGTGLGLAAVYGTVMDLDGVITVDSTPSVGTTMRVVLPVLENADNTTAQSMPPRKTLQPKTVLIVDDESVVRDMAEAMLSDLGYRTLTASDGEHALQLLARAEVDIILLDLVMPKMDGPETLKQVVDRYPNMPVIISSGYMRDGSVADLLKKGAVDFIQKPYPQKTLAEKIAAQFPLADVPSKK